MRFFSLLALAGALAVSGCDSADPVSNEISGPTVAFGTSSTNAAEGGTATIPVTLTGGTGQPVTVEVLFAGRISGTGRASFGSDFTGFGDDRSGTRVATVTFSGAETETQNITFAIADDGAVEDAETAEFALQNATNATIVTPREFRLVIGTPPISSARARAVGETVTVEGVVTRVFGRYIFLQDASAAVVLFLPNASSPLGAAASSGAVAAGDRVQATGPITEFGATTGLPGTGLLQISASDIGERFAVLSRGNALPAAQTITAAQFRDGGDAYEAEIVRIVGLTFVGNTDVVFSNGKTYTVTDGTGNADMRVQGTSDTEVTSAIAVPARFTYTGPTGQFRGTNQLQPTRITDIAPTP